MSDEKSWKRKRRKAAVRMAEIARGLCHRFVVRIPDDMTDSEVGLYVRCCNRIAENAEVEDPTGTVFVHAFTYEGAEDVQERKTSANKVAELLRDEGFSVHCHTRKETSAIGDGGIYVYVIDIVITP